MANSIASQVVHPCAGFEDSISPSRGARHVGILPLSLYWLRNHTGGDLYRLGRLGYMRRHPDQFSPLKNKES